MILIYAVVYFAAPNVEIRRFQWITPGALFGVLAWLLASAAFFLYVANFGSYEATYGAFAAVVILLVWLWLTNVVLLFGAELNAVDRPAALAAPVRALRRPAAAGQGARGRLARRASRNAPGPRGRQRALLGVRAQRAAARAVGAQLAVRALA